MMQSAVIRGISNLPPLNLLLDLLSFIIFVYNTRHLFLTIITPIDEH